MKHNLQPCDGSTNRRYLVLLYIGIHASNQKDLEDV